MIILDQSFETKVLLIPFKSLTVMNSERPHIT